jgi:K+-transporting ATPase A subunit
MDANPAAVPFEWPTILSVIVSIFVINLIINSFVIVFQYFIIKYKISFKFETIIY